MPATAFEYFVNRNNALVVSLLERNHDVSQVIMSLLEQAVAFCQDKGIPFENLKLVDAHVIPTDNGDAKIEARFKSGPV